MSVIKPWIPVTAEKNSSGYDISVLNRNYKLTEKSPFFSSVTSLGEELLASPMRIVAENLRCSARARNTGSGRAWRSASGSPPGCPRFPASDPGRCPDCGQNRLWQGSCSAHS